MAALALAMPLALAGPLAPRWLCAAELLQLGCEDAELLVGPVLVRACMYDTNARKATTLHNSHN